MKLKLRSSGDVHILTITELQSAENLTVLRAGITKSFRAGKNRIILELPEAEQIPAEILRELARLKLLANELSGDIVLAGLDEQTLRNIENFSKPPFAACFSTTEQALEHFRPAEAPEAAAPAAAVSEHRQRVLAEAGGDVGALRKENERLRAEVRSLTELFATKVLERRAPPDAKALQEKLSLLEGQLAELLGQPPAKKS